MAETSVIIINYNGSADTIRCVMSLLNSTYHNFNIILVDNDSPESDQLQILNWLSGNLQLDMELGSPINPQYRTVTPPKFRVLEYEAGHFNPDWQNPGTDEKLFFVKAKKNNGFAAGNNIGLKLAAALKSRFLWMINNDTEIEPQALNALINFARQLQSRGESTGLIGSAVLYYDSPDTIQSLGGRFKPMISKNAHHSGEISFSSINKNAEIKIDYPYGAAIFTDNKFVESVGLMHEDYFLLYEELDWATRGRRKKFKVRACLQSIVYHKQGSSIGRKMNKPHTPFTACLRYRNFLKFYRRFYPYLMVIAYLHLIYKWVGCLKQKKYDEMKIIRKVFFGFGDCDSCKKN